jgi:hypothetical protein
MGQFLQGFCSSVVLPCHRTPSGITISPPQLWCQSEQNRFTLDSSSRFPASQMRSANGPLKSCFWFEWGYSHVTDMVRKRTYVVLMRRGVRRFQQSRESHFISICCYHRRRLLSSNESRRISEPAWERVWRSYGLQVCESVVALSERRRGGSVIEITHSSQRAA